MEVTYIYLREHDTLFYTLSLIHNHTECVIGDAPRANFSWPHSTAKPPCHVFSAPPEVMMEFTAWRTHTWRKT